MVTNPISAPNVRFKADWLLMLGLSGLMAASYVLLIFIQKDETTLFMGYTAFSLYAFLVLLIPFRQGKKWAWLATWILPVVLALTAYFVPDFGPYYYASAAACALALLLAMPAFFSNRLGE